ncbi:hypothetical protein F7725_009321 [Dissostichus mawsoni]|uniref:VPS9 domain-containing protein n=1 Tax=Dissostichus mawsoni TaxID=36200 RepID=A0A7J5Z6P6_DISMA|nr:hypothetical protein F7725_009321 [Dissostichus mawsoni]
MRQIQRRNSAKVRTIFGSVNITEMNNKQRRSEDDGDGERGLLHTWKGYSCSVTPERLLLPGPVLQVALGTRHGVLLVEGGQVYSFGELPWKQSQVSEPSKPTLEGALSGQRVVSVAAGSFHSGAVTEDGGVHMWGDNSSGQCGLSGLSSVPNPTPVALLDSDNAPLQMVPVLELACGGGHTLALSAQREVWAWGSGSQLGLNVSVFPVWKPQKVEHFAGRCVLQVACGASHSLALVRCLGPQDLHRPPVDKCRQCHQLLYTMTDKEDHVIISDGHYCPLGVELTEDEVPALTEGLKIEPPLPSHTSTPLTPSLTPLRTRRNMKGGVSGVKSSPYPDEQAVKEYLKKLTEAEQVTKPSSGALTFQLHPQQPGGLLRLRSGGAGRLHLRGPVAEEDDDLPPLRSGEVRRPRRITGVLVGDTTAERVRLEDSTQAKKSSSTGDIREEEAEGLRRRLSLPGLLSQGRYAVHVLSNSYTLLLSPRLLRRAGRPRMRAVDLTPLGGAFPEAQEVFPTLQTEVWSWGQGEDGQLGHGDNLARLQPLCIKSLNRKEVVRVEAGAHHSLALTAQSQVFSWGSNTSGQLGHTESPSTVPRLAKVRKNFLSITNTHKDTDKCIHFNLSPPPPPPTAIRGDPGLGRERRRDTLLLADGDCYRPIIYYSGQQVKEGAEESHAKEQGQQEEGGRRSRGRGLHPAACSLSCLQLGYVSNVFAGGQRCVVLLERNVMGFIASLHELAAAERKFYCKLSNIKTQIIRPLLELESLSSALGPVVLGLLQTVAGRFSLLCHLTGQHAASLTGNLRRVRDVKSLLVLEHADIFLDSYSEYCSAVGNLQVMGGFQTLTKPSIDFFGKSPELLKKLSECSEETPTVADLLGALFYLPTRHLHDYGRLLLKLATCFEVVEAAGQLLKFEALALKLKRKKKDAEYTFHFWKSFPGKMTVNSQSVCVLHNESWKGHMISPPIMSSLGHTLGGAHPRGEQRPVWVKVDHTRGDVCPARVLSHGEGQVAPLHQPGGGAGAGRAGQDTASIGSVSSQKTEPPVSRTASYTFYKEGRLKEAKYEGHWLSGKPNGSGVLKWPDGRIYTGFKNGLEDGFGEFVATNKTLNKNDQYQGHWKDGKMHGLGTYSYASGEVYDGCFQDSMRHGHGMLRSGKLNTSSPSVFIGQWLQDKKTGYGVLDDITKYAHQSRREVHGHVAGSPAAGNGVVVTQFGLYYEGAFKENKMMGTGILLSEDDTTYEGEFSDDWTLNGKGVLTMPNADYLEGSFNGEWGSGLKVTGSYFKPHLFDTDKDKTRDVKLGRLCVCAEDKWQAVFEECWSELGCETPGQGENWKAWENIASALTTSRRLIQDSPEALSRSQSRTLESLEVIPQHEGPITMERYHTIRLYLIKACDTPLHSLGRLLETLVAVYRMTYVGVGANRRLLPQAVNEIKSYLNCIFLIVRFLFPDLPEEGGLIPEPTTNLQDKREPGSSDAHLESPKPGRVVSSSALLLPPASSPLPPPLHPLRSGQGERGRRVLGVCSASTSSPTSPCSPSSGSSSTKFWPVSIPTAISELAEKQQVWSCLALRDVCFASAVETLQQISTTFTPSDKLQVIQLTFEEITQAVQSLLKQDFLWSMDDLFPVFLYVVLRARIRNLGSEVSLIEDLMDPCVQHGEHGIMFTTLKACYYQIQHEKIT